LDNFGFAEHDEGDCAPNVADIQRFIVGIEQEHVVLGHGYSSPIARIGRFQTKKVRMPIIDTRTLSGPHRIPGISVSWCIKGQADWSDPLTLLDNMVIL
jgi:hypothetical protein